MLNHRYLHPYLITLLFKCIQQCLSLCNTPLIGLANQLLENFPGSLRITHLDIGLSKIEFNVGSIQSLDIINTGKLICFQRAFRSQLSQALIEIITAWQFNNIAFTTVLMLLFLFVELDIKIIEIQSFKIEIIIERIGFVWF